MTVPGSQFSDPTNDHNLTKEELINEIRSLVSAEYEAIQKCVHLTESTADTAAEEELKKIADEHIFKLYCYLN